MADDVVPAGQGARLEVVRLPARLSGPAAGQAGDQLLAAIGSGAAVVVADLSALVAWDQAGAAAVVRAYQKAAVSGTELRLVACAQPARDLITGESLDRLVPVYPSLQAAEASGAAGPPRPVPGLPTPGHARDPAGAGGENARPAVSEVVLRQLIDALGDGIALTDEDGTIVLASRRLAEMLGYQPGELTGQGVDTLVPAGLRDAHRQDRAAYLRDPVSRPMSGRPRLAGLRKDGGTIPVSITLSPVPTATGHLILAVVRDNGQAGRRQDLAGLARAAAAEQARHSQELLDAVISSLFHVGLSLQTALDQPAETARERITGALQRLDDTIHQVRDHVFGPAGRPGPPSRLGDPPGP